MKHSIVAATGAWLLVAAPLASGQVTKPAAPAANPADLRSQASYGLGVTIGQRFKSQSVDLDPDQFTRGLKDVLNGGKVAMTDDQIRQALQAYEKQIIGQKLDANKRFFADNKAKPGVVALPSGLQYKVVKEGTGKTPKATDKVTTHYKGSLLDGTEFDSSYKRGQPSSFEVNGVIPGWTEALQKMKEGDKWQLFIPSELAYGESPPEGSNIPPNAILVFEIELIKVN